MKNMNTEPAPNNARVSAAILGDTSTQLLSAEIKARCIETGIDADIFEAGYNQIDYTVFDDNSPLYAKPFDFILIYLSSEKLYDRFIGTDTDKRQSFADDFISRIDSLYSKIRSKSGSKIILYNFIAPDNDIFGSFALLVPSSFTFQVHKLNFLLNSYAISKQNVFIADFNKLCQQSGYDNITDKRYYYAARIAVNMEYLPLMAKLPADIIAAALGKIKKCVVFDLDNTVWGGVIGDDGIGGIEIGELGKGRAYSDMQRFLKELKNRGVILAVCSKNNEETAKEPFINHPDCVLKMEDIAVFTANFNDKASNIIQIAERLNIGLNSMVFIDDNSFERELVKKSLPEVTVPELPEDPENYVTYIKSLNLFETVSFSDEDLKRTYQYRAERERLNMKEKFVNIEDYLISLDMRAEVFPFTKNNINRIAQLTQRTNQFNFRTVRYTQSDAENIMNDDNYIPLAFSLKDKYGDYGIISAVILKRERGALFIENWVMSCRVFQRGMEYFIMDTVVKTARDTGADIIEGEYLETGKNIIIKDLYKELGFMPKNDRYELRLNDYKGRKHFIKERTDV